MDLANIQRIKDQVDKLYEECKRINGDNKIDPPLCPLIESLFDGSCTLWKLVIARWISFNAHRDYNHPTFDSGRVKERIFSLNGSVACKTCVKEDFTNLDHYGFKYVIVKDAYNDVYVCSNFAARPYVLEKGEQLITRLDVWKHMIDNE